MKKFPLIYGIAAVGLLLGACSEAGNPLDPQFAFQNTPDSELINSQGVCVDNGDGTGASGASGKFEAGWDDGDPFLTFTAPTGYVIYKYCVKAGSTQSGGGALIINVTPPAATVIIDHPNVGSVSHFVAYYMQANGNGQWCSPGYWRNHPAAWEATGYDPAAPFPGTVTRSPQGVRQNAPTTPTLWQVVSNPQWYGGESFNMVGDLLSAAHPDVDFQGARVAGSCPLN